MGKFILRRLLLLIPILLGLTLLVFLFIRALPGDPAGAILGERATPEAIERVRQALGLDRAADRAVPRPTSPASSASTSGQLHHQPRRHRRLPAALPGHHRADAGGDGSSRSALGIPLGMFTAKRHGTWLDSGGTVASLIGISIPIFFLGLMLKFLFAIHWPILPDSGRIDLIDLRHPEGHELHDHRRAAGRAAGAASSTPSATWSCRPSRSARSRSRSSCASRAPA